jgi:hypothetical protein
VLKAWDKVPRNTLKQSFFKKVLSPKTFAGRLSYRRIGHPPYELAADYYWKALTLKVQNPRGVWANQTS